MTLRTLVACSFSLLWGAGCAGPAEDLEDDADVGSLEQGLLSCDGVPDGLCHAGVTYTAAYRIGVGATSRSALVQPFSSGTGGLPSTLRLGLRSLRRYTGEAVVTARVLGFGGDLPTVFDAATLEGAEVLAQASVPAADRRGAIDFDLANGDVTPSPLEPSTMYVLEIRVEEPAEGTTLIGVAALASGLYAGGTTRWIERGPAVAFRAAGAYDLAFALGYAVPPTTDCLDATSGITQIDCNASYVDLTVAAAFLRPFTQTFPCTVLVGGQAHSCAFNVPGGVSGENVCTITLPEPTKPSCLRMVRVDDAVASQRADCHYDDEASPQIERQFSWPPGSLSQTARFSQIFHCGGTEPAVLSANGARNLATVAVGASFTLAWTTARAGCELSVQSGTSSFSDDLGAAVPVTTGSTGSVSVPAATPGVLQYELRCIDGNVTTTRLLVYVE